MMKKSTSLLCGIALAVPVAASAQLFVDGFDTAGSAAAWNVQKTSADTQIDFGWDYSALGIPAAPNGVGTTGVRMAANIASPTSVEGLSMTPIGVVLPTNYTVRFDLWMNVNGPFPGGGGGSTEFASYGLGANGTQVQWDGAAGQTFAGSGEGGTSADYRVYDEGVLAAAESGVYAAGIDAASRNASHAYYMAAFPGQTAPALQQTNYPQQDADPLADGTLGFAWRDVRIEVMGANYEWYVDDVLLASHTFAGGGSPFLGYYDPFTSVSDNSDLSFAVYDNFQVIPEPSTYALIAGLGILGLAVWRRSRKSVA